MVNPTTSVTLVSDYFVSVGFEFYVDFTDSFPVVFDDEFTEDAVEFSISEDINNPLLVGGKMYLAHTKIVLAF